MIAVVDIDGVLADAGHRQHFLDGRPKDWPAFFAAVGGDTVIADGRDLVARLAADHDVVLLSGRPESTRADTEEWLRANGVAFARLVLRPDADRRPARRFKGHALRRLGTPEEVAVVVDDDPTVVEEITRIGYRAMLFP